MVESNEFECSSLASSQGEALKQMLTRLRNKQNKLLAFYLPSGQWVGSSIRKNPTANTQLSGLGSLLLIEMIV